MVMYLGLLLPIAYIVVQAQEDGVSDYLAGKLLVIINAASSTYDSIESFKNKWLTFDSGRTNDTCMGGRLYRPL